MSAKDYHARSAISSSGLKEFRKSPAHFWHWRENGVFDPNIAPFRMGGGLHSLCLDIVPNLLLFSETKTLASKAGEKFIAANPDSWVLSADEHEIVQGMADSLMLNPTISKLLAKCEKEREIYWQEDGVECKAMLDMVHPKALLDIKTTSDAAPFFKWNAKRYGYDIQAAWYRRAVQQLTGERLPFYFVVVEKLPPHGVMIYELDEATMDQADAEIEGLLTSYRACLKDKSWPSYTMDIQTIGWIK